MEIKIFRTKVKEDEYKNQGMKLLTCYSEIHL
jgi:hypothetical protein